MGTCSKVLGGIDAPGFAQLIAPVVTTASIILCFHEHRLTQVQSEE